MKTRIARIKNQFFAYNLVHTLSFTTNQFYPCFALRSKKMLKSTAKYPHQDCHFNRILANPCSKILCQPCHFTSLSFLLTKTLNMTRPARQRKRSTPRHRGRGRVSECPLATEGRHYTLMQDWPFRKVLSPAASQAQFTLTSFPSPVISSWGAGGFLYCRCAYSEPEPDVFKL